MTNTFTEFMGGIIKDVAAATAEWRRKPLREQFPDASDAILDHIIDLNGQIETAHHRELYLKHDCDELREKLGRYDSDLTLEEISRRRALAELRLTELKIANLEAEA
jgi:hypothetical protein